MDPKYLPEFGDPKYWPEPLNEIKKKRVEKRFKISSQRMLQMPPEDLIQVLRNNGFNTELEIKQLTHPTKDYIEYIQQQWEIVRDGEKFDDEKKDTKEDNNEFLMVLLLKNHLGEGYYKLNNNFLPLFELLCKLIPKLTLSELSIVEEFIVKKRTLFTTPEYAELKDRIFQARSKFELPQLPPPPVEPLQLFTEEDFKLLEN